MTLLRSAFWARVLARDIGDKHFVQFGGFAENAIGPPRQGTESLCERSHRVPVKLRPQNICHGLTDLSWFSFCHWYRIVRSREIPSIRLLALRICLCTWLPTALSWRVGLWGKTDREPAWFIEVKARGQGRHCSDIFWPGYWINLDTPSTTTTSSAVTYFALSKSSVRHLAYARYQNLKIPLKHCGAPPPPGSVCSSELNN